MKATNFLTSISHFFPFEIFTVSQIERARDQNQSTGVDIFSGNFEEKNKSENGADQQFQISIRSNGGDINQAKRFENKILNEVSTSPQKEEHCQFERSRSHPNFESCRKRNKAGNESEIEQHGDSIFFCRDHFFDENILQREKERCANRNAIKNVEMKIIIGRPTSDKRQSDESDQSCGPAKFRYIFAEKNLGQNQRKQRNRPENNDDFSQRQFDHSVDVEKETYCAKNSANDIQKELICSKRRLSAGNYERKQRDQSEKKSEKSYFEGAQSLAHKFRNDIVCAADEHLAEKKHDPLPVSIQDHKFSEIKSRLFITFVVRNENIF